MSGILSGIGKVFKSVFNVVKKVALPALAIGAIVLTGGAALGVLPAVGTVIGGLGLSAGVTAALTSAVTMAGWGGLAGLLTGGVKGMEKGALIGGLLGGVGGAAGLFGGAGAAAAGAGTSIGVDGAVDSITGAAGGVGGAADSLFAATPAAAALGGAAPAGLVAAAPAAAGGGGGFSGLTGLLGNGGLGSILSGIGSGESAAAQAKAEQEAFDHKMKFIQGNYDLSKSPLQSSLLSPYATPGYMASPELDPFAGTTQWQYDPEQGRMVRKMVMPTSTPQPAGGVH